MLYESAICNEFLDETYPQKPLFPKDPYQKARFKILMELYGKVSWLVGWAIYVKRKMQNAVCTGIVN